VTDPATPPQTTQDEADHPPPKLFGWLMEQQEQKDNAAMRGAILVEASRLLQEYLQDTNPSAAPDSK
jgi:hypothetical protein